MLLTGLVPASPVTACMYGDEEWQRARRVMEAVDGINAQMGERHQVWRDGPEAQVDDEEREAFARYTTSWDELLRIS